MMDNFFKNKIEKLTDDDLIDLFEKSRQDPANAKIHQLAKAEVEKRKLDFNPLDLQVSNDKITEKSDHNIKDLNHWNWGAFFLTPFWALSHNLDKWAILSLLPPFNLIAIIYLGLHGNKLAYEKSKIDSVDDFMAVQKGWAKWAIRIFLFLLGIGVIGSFVNN